MGMTGTLNLKKGCKIASTELNTHRLTDLILIYKKETVEKPAPAAPETAPVKTAQVETAPVKTAQVEPAPVKTAPVETAPVEPAPVKPVPSTPEPKKKSKPETKVSLNLHIYIFYMGS